MNHTSINQNTQLIVRDDEVHKILIKVNSKYLREQWFKSVQTFLSGRIDYNK